MEALKALLTQLGGIWKELGLNQKITVVFSAVVLAAALAAVVFFSSHKEFALLFGRLDSEQAGKVVAALDEQVIPYKVGEGGGAIYVHREAVHKTRMQLAAKGIPKSEGVGYEIFDKPAFGMSDFVQRANYSRAVQGELARTIGQLDGVESARVMIVMPENRLIVDPTKKPTASVFVKLSKAGTLDEQAVNSVRFLVANAVPGLKYNNVSVVDNNGNTLSANEEEGSFAAVSGNRLMAQRNLELYLSHKVQGLLESVLGSGEAKVTLNADIDHSQVTSEREFFDPTGQVARASMTRREDTDTVSPKPGGVAGATINASTTTNVTSPAVAGATLSKNESTTEFALSRSKTNVVQMAGNVQRVTASVLVNQRVVDGQVVTRDAAAMGQLTNIVRNALGAQLAADAARKDDITVVEMPFNTVKADRLKLEFDREEAKAFYWEVGRGALYILLGIAALYVFWTLVGRSAEEVIPMGVPVGQLMMPGMMPMMAGHGVAAMQGMPSGPAAGEQLDAAKMGLEDIDAKLKDPTKLSVAEIQALKKRREEERERVRLLEELKSEDSESEEEFEVIKQQKQKLIMDFGLGKKRPERVNIEVLREMISGNPEQMGSAARRWLAQASAESEADNAETPKGGA